MSEVTALAVLQAKESARFDAILKQHCSDLSKLTGQVDKAHTKIRDLEEVATSRELKICELREDIAILKENESTNTDYRVSAEKMTKYSRSFIGVAWVVIMWYSSQDFTIGFVSQEALPTKIEVHADA